MPDTLLDLKIYDHEFHNTDPAIEIERVGFAFIVDEDDEDVVVLKRYGFQYYADLSGL